MQCKGFDSLSHLCLGQGNEEFLTLTYTMNYKHSFAIPKRVPACDVTEIPVYRCCGMNRKGNVAIPVVGDDLQGVT